MLDLRVDTEVLRSAAARLDELGARLQAPARHPTVERHGQYGGAGLTAAAGGFGESWSAGLRHLADRPARLADGVRVYRIQP
jgi:hypothetical protein